MNLLDVVLLLLPRVLLAGPFNVFYAAGFLLVFVLVWRSDDARLRGAHQQQSARISAHAKAGWLLAVAVAGMLGSRLLHFDGSIDAMGDRTVLGGLLGVLVAARIGVYALRGGRPLADALALALPLGFAVGRVGCLLAGCCFGAPAGLPWSVVYGPGSAAFAAQVGAGLLAADAAHAHAVHPVQLYEAAVALLIATVAWHARRRGAVGLLVPVAAVYLTARLPLQLLRGSEGSATMAALALALAALLVCSRGRAATAAASLLACRRLRGVLQSSRAAVVLATAASIATLAIATPLELAVLTGLSILAGAGIVAAAATPIVAAVATPMVAARPAYAAVLPALSLLLLQIPTDPAAFPQRYVAVGAGATGGRYVESCGGAHSYRMGGVSATYVSLPQPNQRYALRAQAFGGSDREDDGTQTGVSGVSIAGSAHYHWIGASLGVMAGGLYFDGSPETVLPILALTLGPPPFYLEGRIFDAEPAGVPAPGLQIGIATRVHRDGSLLRLGVSDAGFYLSGVVVTPGGLEIEPRAAFGDATTSQFGLSVRKRIALRPPGDGRQ